MQNFELLLILASTFYIVFKRRINNNFNKLFILAALVIILILQVSLEGYRWQMLPAYMIWLVAVVTAMKSSKKKPSIMLRVLKIFVMIILLALALFLPSILPVFDLPENTGTYTVGTRDILLELDRDEVITDDASDKRSFMIKAWYPSNATEGEMDPYVDAAGRMGFAQKYGLRSDMMDYLDQIETRVYRDVDIAKERFPVLIFSHGYNSKANGYYAMISEIVSHGYIVLGINHTYESTGATFPDGSMKYYDYEYARKIEEGTWEEMAPVRDAFKSDMNFEERHPMVQKALRTYFVKGIVERWAADISDVVDQLEDWNSRGFFIGRMDLDKVATFGHSRGGGAAGASLLIDERIQAGANVDGVQWGQIVDTIFQKPFLFISADWPADHENLNQHAYINKSDDTFYEALIRETGHSNFMDIPYMIPVQALSGAGIIDPYLANEISTQTLLAFFDKHLKGEDADVEDVADRYKELEMKTYVPMVRLDSLKR